MQFTNNIPAILDNKNRIAIPAKWRDKFDAPAYLTSGDEPCITVFTKETFEGRAREVLELPAGSVQGRDARRRFFGRTVDIACDAAGRITLTAPLVAHAGLERDLIFVGAGEWFEIWDRDRWSAYQQEMGG